MRSKSSPFRGRKIFDILAIGLSLLCLWPSYTYTQPTPYSEDKEAQEYFQKLKQNPDPKAQMYLYGKLGQFYMYQDASQSITYNLKALKLARTVGTISDQCHYNRLTATSYSILGKKDSATIYNYDALELALPIQDTTLSEIYNGLAINYGEMFEFQQAYEFFEKSIAVSYELGLPHKAIPALGAKANFLAREGKFNEALPIVRKAYKQAQEINADKYQAYSLKDISYLYLHLGNLDSATYYAYKSIALSEKKNNFSFIASEAYYHLCMIDRAKGQFESSIAHGNKGLRIAQEVKTQRVQVLILRALADTYEKYHQYDQALLRSLEALKVANEYKVQQEIYNCYVQLSDLYHKKGDLQNAFNYKSLEAALSLQLEKKKKKILLSVLEKKYDFQKKSDENEALKYELQKEKNALKKNSFFGIFMTLFFLSTVLIFFLTIRFGKTNFQLLFDEAPIQKDINQRIALAKRQAIIGIILTAPLLIYYCLWGTTWQIGFSLLFDIILVLILILCNQGKLNAVFYTGLLTFYPAMAASPFWLGYLALEFNAIVCIFISLNYLGSGKRQLIYNGIGLVTTFAFQTIIHNIYQPPQVENAQILEFLSGCILLFIIIIMLNFISRNLEEYKRDLLKSNSFLRQISDLNPHHIFAKDKKRKFTFVNEALVDTYRVSNEQIVGIKDEELHPLFKEQAHFREDDLQVIEKGIEVIREEEMVHNYKGEEKWLHTIKRPIYIQGEIMGLLGVSTDITEKRKTEEALKEREATLHATINGLVDPVLAVDTSIKPIVFNQAFGKWIQKLYQVRYHTGTKWETVFDENFVEKFNPLVLRVLEGECIEVNHEIVLPEKTYFFKVSISPIRKKDLSIIGAVIVGRDISALKETTKALEDSQITYLNLYEKMFDGVMLYDFMEEKVVELNPAAQQILGYKIQPDKKLSRFEFVPKEVHQLPGKNLHEISNKHKEKVIAGKTIHCVGFLRKKNHDIVTVDLTIFPLSQKEGIAIIIIKDITQERLNRLKLEERQRIYEALIEHSFEGIEIIELTKIDKKALQFEGKTVVRNEKMDEVFPPEVSPVINIEEVMKFSPPYQEGNQPSKPLFESWIKKLNKERHIQTHWRLYNIHGEVREKEISAQLIYIKNRVLLVRIFKDVTKTKKQQQIIQQQLEDLSLKNRELKTYIESNLNLENFAYLASHDLKAPIRTLVSFAQLLEKRLEGKIEGDEKEFLDFIIASSQNMLRLINDLLTFSRVNTAKLNLQTLQLPELIQESIEALKVEVEEKQACFQFTNIPAEIFGDPIKIKQLFQNLISNGIKFCPRDRTPQIQISCEQAGEYWMFSVKDNGIGIEQKYQKKIFTLFKRLHTQSEYEGTGIGLALCKKIVQQHKGEMKLHSVPDQGSTFSFSIPIKKSKHKSRKSLIPQHSLSENIEEDQPYKS